MIVERQHERVCLILPRQAVPTLERTKYGSAEWLRKGAYVLADASGGNPDVLLCTLWTICKRLRVAPPY